MAYEFKSLSTVEKLTEVPENANAFIEVDGAIKRVSGSSLGGGEYDLVITANNDGCAIESGSYQNVYDKIMVAQEPPKILIKYCFQYGDYGYGVTTKYHYADIIVNSEDSSSHYLHIQYYTAQWYTCDLYVYPDGTISQ